MLNFDYQNKTRIIFGKDTHKNIGELVKPYAKKVLFHFGGQSIKNTGVYDEVVKSLKENNVDYVELGGVKPNPRVSLVREGIEICRKENVDFILAVGGGSVIDSAKAIAIGIDYEGDVWDFFEKGITIEKALPIATILTIPAAGSESSTGTVITNAIGIDYEGDVWDFFEKGITIEKALPIATILTIPAAGSESSTGTVITNEEKELKLSCGAPILRPVLSVINPRLYFTLPKNQVANGVSDMMSHIMERYFTNTTNTELIDGLCESTLKTIMRNGLILNKDNKNYDAWAEIALAGNIAHNGLLGLGREDDWASHDIEHELSAIYDVAHGAGLSVVTPAWMKYVYKENIDMFVQFAVNVMGVEGNLRNREDVVLKGINKLEEFYKAMGLPTTLKELNIGDENLELMAKKSTNFISNNERPLGSFKKLKWEDVLEIYKLAK